jgi:hypothetical protein
MKKLSLNNINYSDFQEFIEKLLQDEDKLFTLSMEDIGKLFLKEVEGNDIFEKFTFQEIRTYIIKYVETIFADSLTITGIKLEPPEIPQEKQHFYTFICEMMGINKDPRLCLLELYKDAAEDLREIEERINKYQQEIKKNSQHSDTDENDSYEDSIMKHYIQVNENAKNEIIKFITTESIKSTAISEARYYGILPKQDYYNTYTYREKQRYLLSRYDKDKLSEIANKFLYATSEQMKKLEVLYKTGNSKFYEYAHQYIREKNIITEIKEYIERNHFLNARANILVPILDYYEHNNLLLFLNLAPLQIEGIFHDYCLGLGISEKSLQKASIGEKLDQIVKENPNLCDFEYFKFIFPKTRNRVAHGKLFSPKEENQISCLLLLDLHDVCSRITSEDIPINLMVNILKEIKSGHYTTSPNLLLEAKYGLIEKIEYHPKFYNLEGVIDLVEDKCKEDIFFNYLGEVIRESTNDPVIIKAMKKILSSYKNNKIQIDKCIELFKEIQKIDLPNNKNVIKEGFIDFCAAFRVNGVI